jgi:hypothetical protein
MLNWPAKFDYNIENPGRSLLILDRPLQCRSGKNGVGMENTLQQGIAAVKAGDKSRAFDLLTRATQDPSTSEQAWLWLSGVVDQDSERLF